MRPRSGLAQRGNKNRCIMSLADDGLVARFRTGRQEKRCDSGHVRTVWCSSCHAGNGCGQSSDIVSHNPIDLDCFATLCRIRGNSFATGRHVAAMFDNGWIRQFKRAFDANHLVAAGCIGSVAIGLHERSTGNAHHHFPSLVTGLTGQRIESNRRGDFADGPIEVVDFQSILGPSPAGGPHLVRRGPASRGGRGLHTTNQPRKIVAAVSALSSDGNGGMNAETQGWSLLTAMVCNEAGLVIDHFNLLRAAVSRGRGIANDLHRLGTGFEPRMFESHVRSRDVDTIRARVA